MGICCIAIMPEFRSVYAEGYRETKRTFTHILWYCTGICGNAGIAMQLMRIKEGMPYREEESIFPPRRLHSSEKAVLFYQFHTFLKRE